MTIYHTNELIFDLPDDLVDKTLNIFSVRDDGPSPFSLVISRTRVEVGESLQRFGERLLSEIARTLQDFFLKKRQPITLDGMPALELEYHWNNQGVTMHQRQVVTILSPPGGVRHALQLTATMTGQAGDDWIPEFDNILRSVRLRHLEPASPPGSNRGRTP